MLDGTPNGIPLLADLDAALRVSAEAGTPATHFVIGLAPDGRPLSPTSGPRRRSSAL